MSEKTDEQEVQETSEETTVENNGEYEESSDFMVSFMETSFKSERYLPFLAFLTKGKSVRVDRLLIGLIASPIILIILVIITVSLTSSVSSGRAYFPSFLVIMAVLMATRLYLIPSGRGTLLGRYVNDFTGAVKKIGGKPLTKRIKIRSDGTWKMSDGRVGYPFYVDGIFTPTMLGTDMIRAKTLIGQQRQFLDNFGEVSLTKIAETTFESQKDNLLDIMKNGDASSRRLAKLNHAYFIKNLKSENIKRKIVVFIAPNEQYFSELTRYLEVLRSQNVIIYYEPLSIEDSERVLDEL